MMRAMLAGGLAVILVAGVEAHALYIVVEGKEVKVVFSDDLNPDKRVKEDSWKKIGTPKLKSAKGEVETKKGEACLTAEVAGSEALLYGESVYGISKHGDKPKHLTFLYKYALPGEAKEATLGEKCALEIVPIAADGKVKFLVLAKGKPVAKSELTIIVPGQKDKAKATTDEKGLTVAFEAKGTYGVTARSTEAKGGEFEGEKYEETAYSATLVTVLK